MVLETGSKLRLTSTRDVETEQPSENSPAQGVRQAPSADSDIVMSSTNRFADMGKEIS